MATVVVKHHPSGGPADPLALVDGPTYDNDPHTVTGLENVPNLDTTNADNITLGSQTGTGAMVRALSPTFPGQVNVTPTAHTTTPGLVVTQSTPTSGSSATELNFNLINITDTYHTTAPGAPFSDFGLNPNNVTGFRVNHSIGGSNLGTDAHVAGLFNMRRNISAVPTGGDALGLAATAYSNQVYGGIAGLSALDAATYIDNGAVEFYVAGIESDIGIITGGTASIRTALNLRNFGNLRGTVSDSAIWVTNQTDNAGSFQNLILLSNLNGFNPISTTGSILKADAAFTVANVLDLSNMTVTGNILNFPKAVLTGAGVLNVGGGTFDGAAGGIQTSVPSGGRVEIFSSTNTTAGVDILAAISSLTTNILTAGVLEPSFTATTFGITAGNWASINAHGSANNGLLLGTGSNSPIVIGTNDTEAGRINTSQQWNMGPNVTLNSGVKLTVNNSNLQVATAGLGSITAQIASATNSVNRLMMNAAGSAPVNVINFISTGGTFAVPTATQNGTVLGGFGSSGFGTTIYGASSAGSGILMNSTQTFTDTAMGSNVVFSTTPNNSITNATALTINSSGGISIGASTGDPGIGAVLANTSIKSQGATSGIGYATGAGGPITQITSRTTGVTLNTVCGAITLFAAAPAVGTWVSFTVTNSAVVATDVPHVSFKSGTNTYIGHVTAVAAGSFQISFTSIVGTASDSPVINFAIIKAVAS